jgi:hypothetical protein
MVKMQEGFIRHFFRGLRLYGVGIGMSLQAFADPWKAKWRPRLIIRYRRKAITQED